MPHFVSTTYCSALDNLFYVKTPKRAESHFHVDTVFLLVCIGKVRNMWKCMNKDNTKVCSVFKISLIPLILQCIMECVTSAS